MTLIHLDPPVTDAVVVIADKPPGWSSHQVVGRVRRLLGTRKVGHAGTLDPMATGVLVLGVNRATRLLGHLMLTEKEYTATMRLGATTTSDDADGDLVEQAGAAGVDAPAIAAAMAPYRGEIDQVPTAVSAIKVDGKRAYQRVRDGEEVELKSRRVTVSRFDLGQVRPGPDGTVDCDVAVTCSSGTYIRALARDVGRDLGCGGHLVGLRRTRVGPFTEAAATVVDQETAAVPVLPIAAAARMSFPVRELAADQAGAVRHGGRLADLTLDGLTALFDGSEFLALYRPRGSGAAPEAVFC